MSERKHYSAKTSIVDNEEQEIVNIYYINESNWYGCSHVRLDIGDERLIAVLDAGAEIPLNFSLDYAIRGVHVNLEGLKLNGTHQLLVKADDFNTLGGSVHTLKKKIYNL